MVFIQTYWQVITAIIIFGVCLVYTLYGRKELKDTNTLTEEQLKIIDQAVSDALDYASKLYITDNTVDIKKISIDFALQQIENSGLIPSQYMVFIKTLIETRVAQVNKVATLVK